MTSAPPAAVTAAPAATAPVPRPVGRWLLLPWLLIALMGTLWALATPIGGSPDEPAHVVKAGSVVRGELLPETMIPTGGVLHVPAALAFEYTQNCFAFFADTPASCAPGFSGDPSALVESYSAASLYNPVYYWMVGWPSLALPDISGIYAMRIVSAVITSFFVASCFFMIGSWKQRRLPTIALLAGLTPIAVYLMGTVNPNALEYTGGLALFTAMLGIVLQPDPRLLGGRLTMVVVAAALVSNSRGISPLWVAVLLAVPLLLLGGRELGALLRRPSVLVSILLIVASALASAWWTLTSNSLGTAPSAGPATPPVNEGVGLSPVEGFFGLLGNFYQQLRQMVGILGWLDTTLHPSVYWVSYVIFALLVVGVLVWVRGRRLVFVIALALAFFFLPPLVQAVYVTAGGFIWQGRYTLILLMTFLLGMAAAIATSPRFDRRPPRVLLGFVAWLFGAAWVYATVYAFATTLRRFASGYKTDWPAMLEPSAWVPPFGAIPLIIAFAVVAAAFALTVVIVGRDPRWVAAPATFSPDGPFGAAPGGEVSAPVRL
ncbi:DUF2142 domain-containing protein [Herbiconiux flava]|uniref:DUF2142 domain-containing protein n=1 Tax=Herbiconiux flava TaxID=881268 RepID=A0A852STM3_9MICO|nr:DUF2142 domain-containing protein [Herbiconiux flava]NYD72346.1 hypothetical protein [Herbiconiux flava]GLK17691.1 hypothetical protein GCM10017602_21730 [Herbiconiux flava]